MKLVERLSQPTTTLPAARCALETTRPCCRGRGYLLDPQGPYTRAKLCECVQRCPACLGKVNTVANNTARLCRTPSPRIAVNTINGASLPARYAKARFDKFNNTSGNCRQGCQFVKTWAANYKPGVKGLLISGPVGVGKTYLLACIVKTLAARGIPCKFVDFFQLINSIKGAYSDNRSDQSIIEPLVNIEVLVIDELGKGRNTEFELTILDQMIMGRYNQDRVIVASTNYQLGKKVPQQRKSGFDQEGSGRFNPEHFGHLENRIESRIFSRLTETTMQYNFEGDDFRKRHVHIASEVDRR